MPSLCGFNILIIDSTEALPLRDRLMRAGAKVHVVSPAGAVVLARQKLIDAAFLLFGLGADSRELCKQLRASGVEIIVTGGDDLPERQKIQRRTVQQELPPSLRLCGPEPPNRIYVH